MGKENDRRRWLGIAAVVAALGVLCLAVGCAGRRAWNPREEVGRARFAAENCLHH